MATEKEIRKRASYQRFGKIYDKMEGKTLPEQMYIIFELLDAYNAFGSQTNASAAIQSIEQLIKDKSNETK